MKKLIRINVWCWIFILLIVIFTVILFSFLLTYKIDKTIKMNIRVDNKKELSIFTNDKAAIFLKKNQNIVLEINKKYFDLKITDINIENNLIFLKINYLPKNLQLIPNTNIVGTLLYSKTNLLESIIHI
ncbi:MAG1140 family protein [Mycoplasmopsis lipofaciens]|uniref:MAG1140 family protein n=1 Tax=Mycoplasmopsis lipofaciens TaxID=114884 RepID=UPI0004882EE4|nr:hypothetical protein [Mycoplasmopsis lipofaciens]